MLSDLLLLPLYILAPTLAAAGLDAAVLALAPTWERARAAAVAVRWVRRFPPTRTPAASLAAAAK